MHQCVQNLREHRTVCASLDIMKRILGTYLDTPSSHLEEPTRHQMIMVSATEPVAQSVNFVKPMY